MLKMFGTVHEMVSLAELNSKWIQKKESGFFAQELTETEKQLQRLQEDAKKVRENNVMNSISGKIKSGGRLSSDEIMYLKKNNPQLLQHYEEIQLEKKTYEKQIRNCKTKEDVEELKLNKMGQFMAEAKDVINNPYISDGMKKELMEKILAKTLVIQEIHIKFVQSPSYEELPENEKEKNDESNAMEEISNDEIIKIEYNNEEEIDTNHIMGLEQDVESGENTFIENDIKKTDDSLEKNIIPKKSDINNSSFGTAITFITGKLEQLKSEFKTIDRTV